MVRRLHYPLMRDIVFKMKALQIGTNIILLGATALLAFGVYSIGTKVKAKGIAVTPSAIAKEIVEATPPASLAPEAASSHNAPLYEGHFVVVNLRDMNIELRNGSATLEQMEILSIGKPGSYYETIGGAYENDYKIKKHLSSIGHVYMPWSIHVFGNFFIHGVPYYEDGTKVSSTYSGGCIRLSDEDAEKIYAFVEKGTPIVVTEGSEYDFAPTATSSNKITSMDMTRFMAGAVSLEVLTQDNQIYDRTSGTYTTRRKLLPRLLKEKDTSVIATLAEDRGEATFLMYMNLKAKSLGLTNTTFESTTAPAITTQEDEARFNAYISMYKTYLRTITSN